MLFPSVLRKRDYWFEHHQKMHYYRARTHRCHCFHPPRWGARNEALIWLMELDSFTFLHHRRRKMMATQMLKSSLTDRLESRMNIVKAMTFPLSIHKSRNLIMYVVVVFLHVWRHDTDYHRKPNQPTLSPNLHDHHSDLASAKMSRSIHNQLLSPNQKIPRLRGKVVPKVLSQHIRGFSNQMKLVE